MNAFARVFDAFLALLFPESGTAALVREMTHADVASLLSPTMHSKNTVGLLPYRHKIVRAAIVEAKFHANKKATGLLAALLRDYLEEFVLEHAALSPQRYVLVPVPLAPGRLKERGYNQAETLCRETGFEMNTGLLARVRETRPQTSLSRQARIENVRGAFAATRTLDPGVHYIVVDDVTTTGATLHEAAGALSRAGAPHVSAVAVAY